jgi:hypothetical protein
VELDGAAIGQKSRMNEKLAAGTHRLRATKDGFATKDTLINLTAGETARLNIKLEPRQP